MTLTIIRNSVMKQCYECEGAYAFFPAQMLTVLPFGWLFYLHGTLTVETFVTVIILSLGMSAPIVAAFNFVDTLAQVGTTVGQVDEILKAEEQVHGNTPVTFVGHYLKDIPLTELYDQVAFVSQTTTSLTIPSGRISAWAAVMQQTPRWRQPPTRRAVTASSPVWSRALTP